jgi:hypothetical protein
VVLLMDTQMDTEKYSALGNPCPRQPPLIILVVRPVQDNQPVTSNLILFSKPINEIYAAKIVTC